MSKQLYINNHRLTIDDEKTYFPFEYVINDLESVNVIGIPGSKTVEIPRCPENDEIFGHIGTLTRMTENLLDDNKSSISFNQTKKTTYELYNDSELISSGLVIVTNVTPTNFEITLEDEITNKLEELTNVYLTDVDLIDSNNYIIEFESNCTNVKNLSSGTTKDIIPTFNYKDTNFSKTTLRCKDETGAMVKTTLPTDCLPLQVRSFKNYDINYAIPVNTIVRSINDQYGLIVEDNIKGMFDELHMLSNTPKNKESVTNITFDKSPNPNLIVGSKVMQMYANDTGLGTSTLITNEPEQYYRAISDSDKRISLGGAQINIISGSTYVDSIWVRQTEGSDRQIWIYDNLNVSSSAKLTTIQSGVWTRIYTKTYTSTASGTSYLIVESPVTNVTKTLDYKKIKREITDLTDWCPNIADSYFNYETSKSVHFAGNNLLPGNDINAKLIYQPKISGSTYNENGSLYVKLNYSIELTTTNIVWPNTYNYYYPDSANQPSVYIKYVSQLSADPNEKLVKTGDYIGSYWIQIDMSKCFTGTSSSVYKPNVYNYEVKLFLNKNCTFDFVNKKCNINIEVPITIDYYTKIFDYLGNLSNYITTTISFCNPNNINEQSYILGSFCSTSFKLNQSNATLKRTDFRTGDLVNSSTIMSKVAVKDFVINLCKFFNLGIKVVDGVLTIFKKKYVKIYDIPIVDQITVIDTGVITFNKLKLSTNLSDSELLTTYQTDNVKKYGEQIINTGYSIKESIKDVVFEPSVPLLFKDVNSFAYDSFTKYSNGGYNLYNHGNVNGLSDKITFGYLNKINSVKEICISDDISAEVKNTLNGQTENDFSMCNSSITYDLTGGTWNWTNNINTVNSKVISEYYTFSPYLFNDNGIIVKSLDMNKSLYDWADLSDVQYPSGTTLYQRLHRNILVDKYNVDTHILKTKMYFDDIINPYLIFNIKNSEYIISKMPEYDPTKNGMYEVELMKVNDLNNYTNPYKPEQGIINIISATALNSSQISVVSKIMFDGFGTVINKGIVYGLNSNPTTSDSTIVDYGTNYQFTLLMDALETNKTYYVRSFFENEFGITYSEQQIVETLSTPTVSTSSVINITPTTAQGGITISSIGGSPITQYGLCWNTLINPTTGNTKTVNYNGGIGTYVDYITGLTYNTTYYVRAYAINSTGISYGDNKIFITQNQSVPVLTTNDYTTIDYTSIEFGGNIVSNGGSAVIEKGLLTSFDGDPITVDDYGAKTIVSGSPFDGIITGLTTGQLYQYRTYATNSIGTGYGQIKYISTLNIEKPTVTIDLVTVDYYQALIDCSVNANGGTITNYGVEIISGATFNGTNLSGGVFSVNLTGLTDNTTYFIKAFATNSAGTNYSAIREFKTINYITPTTIYTDYFYRYTGNNDGIFGGTIFKDVDTTISEVGFCWNTIGEPTIEDNHISDIYSTNSFSLSAIGYFTGTIGRYYGRAYCKDNYGNITYGDIINDSLPIE